MTIKLDALIVPSAYDIDPFLENRDLVEFIKKQNQSTAWLASNCSGAFLLAEAGLLNGKRATTWAGGENDLLKAYPKVKVQFDQNFVTDGKLLTSNGGSVSYQAALELLAKLKVRNGDFRVDSVQSVRGCIQAA
jgi:transcriptional regulator GlxA family with amidase domain